MLPGYEGCSFIITVMRQVSAAIVFLLILCFSAAYGKNLSFFIPLPGSCTHVSGIKGNRIYVEDDTDCSSGKRHGFSITRVEVPAEELKGKDVLEIYYGGKLWKSIPVAEGNSLESMLEMVSELAYEGFYRDLEKKGVLAGMDRERLAEVEKSLHEVESYVQSDEFREKIEGAKRKISRGVLFHSGASRSRKKSVRRESLLREDERVYVFVSSSMPLDAVRAYVRDASRLKSRNVIFVLRGGVKGLRFMRPTVEWVYSVIVRDPGCLDSGGKCRVYPVRFQIDPFLFRRFGINEVPAVVYVRGVVPRAGYSEGLPETKMGKAFVSYGDVSFFYHLFVLGRASGNERLKKFAEKFLNYPPGAPGQ